MGNKSTPLTAQPRLGFIAGFISWRPNRASQGISVLPAHHISIRLTKNSLAYIPESRQTYILHSGTDINSSPKDKSETPPPPAQPTATMCRQYYRYCRDCHELFAMPEPDMREACEAFQKVQAIKTHLKKCPVGETPVIRSQSGHGGKVCERCSKKNHNEQRQRENAQKRARRAKLKRDKMTAGIGAGNVVWTPPSNWTAGVVDAQIVALHSPQPKRLNTSKMRLITQAYHFGLDGSSAMMTPNHLNALQQGCGIYSESRQQFTATLSNVPQSQEGECDKIATEMRNEPKLHDPYRSGPQDVTTTKLDIPLYQEEQREEVDLGIALNNDSKCVQSHTEKFSFSDFRLRMELNQWCTVFGDNDDSNMATSSGEF